MRDPFAYAEGIALGLAIGFIGTSTAALDYTGDTTFVGGIWLGVGFLIVIGVARFLYV